MGYYKNNKISSLFDKEGANKILIINENEI
jgi:hypothetical protein